MIEMVRSQRPIEASAIKGKYMVMALPMSAYRSMFPGTPIFVENADDSKSKMQAWPIRVHFNDASVCQDMRVMRGKDDLILKRMESFSGFICDNEADVLTLINSRFEIEKIVSKAGHVNDSIITGELEAYFSDMIESSKLKPAAPEADKVLAWA
jgi:hypothetical protein